MLELGIVGLPNVGKSSLFNALTCSAAVLAKEEGSAKVGNFPFTTIEPNVGTVAVPDERLEFLGEAFNSAKIVPATIKFVDIAGLVKGASAGEGLGNKFLSHIRSVDAIVEVVRVFEDELVSHVHGRIDPDNDIATINTELLLTDLEQASKLIETLGKKFSKPYVINDVRLLEQAIKLLSAEKPLRKDPVLSRQLKHYQFLTAKPMLYLANVSGDNADISTIESQAISEGAEVVVINIKAELEVVKLPKSEQTQYRQELGLASGLDEVIKTGYELLGLITFFTAGPKESRAWTLARSAKAPQAAGKIHTDFEKGFIRAQVYRFDELKKLGSEKAIKEAGKLRSEGRDYVVQDGDVIEFLFNV